MKPNSLLVGFAVFALATGASAQGLRAVKPIPGYMCMRLKLTHEQVVDRSFAVPVFVGPSASSGRLGNASAIVIVKSPLHTENGFAEILFPNGRPGWITKDVLAPYATTEYPNAHCTPSVMSNGRIGFN